MNFDNSYANLPGTFYSAQNPVKVASPRLNVFNVLLSDSLGLNTNFLQSEDGIAVLSGNTVPEDAFPLAQAYAGHQFGYFTMLGDGRALLIGEHITPSGERYDIQLKGSGRTPYSRGGDGRAALGPMLREYIISEAMFAFGIPTTRSLAVLTTGEQVYRETILQGAILVRIAASHLRVGTFQYAAKWGTASELKALADYTINRHYPDVNSADNKYLALLKEVIRRQASLIAKWQLVGFIHGVMNTDNMAISGETIDYGPCAFMDTYDPETVFSSIDRYGRYSYQNQPKIAVWNLSRFAETLLPLIDSDEKRAVSLAEGAVSSFNDLFKENWLNGMRAKLGIINEEPEDEDLAKNLLDIMQKNNSDYTNTFRALTLDKQTNEALFNSDEFQKWQIKWKDRLSRQQAQGSISRELMRKSNPAIIARNHRVEEALEAANLGDNSVMIKLLNSLSNPFAYSKEQEEYAVLPDVSSCKYRTFCGT